MLHLLELIGVAVFAVSGVLAAGRKGLDWFGAGVIAVVTAIGGGTLRDILLNRHPIFWVGDPAYLWVILAAIVVSLSYIRIWVASRHALLIVDALGLAFFTIGGVEIARNQGNAEPVALLMGAITGVFGGVLRDVLTAEIPLVLRPGRLYATAAIFGAFAYLVLIRLGLAQTPSAFIGMGLIAVSRFAAILWEIRLPMVRLPAGTNASPPDL